MESCAQNNAKKTARSRTVFSINIIFIRNPLKSRQTETGRQTKRKELIVENQVDFSSAKSCLIVEIRMGKPLIPKRKKSVAAADPDALILQSGRQKPPLSDLRPVSYYALATQTSIHIITYAFSFSLLVNLYFKRSKLLKVFSQTFGRITLKHSSTIA